MLRQGRTRYADIAPERSLGALVPYDRRREAATVTPLVRRSTTTATERYPQDGAIISALKRSGIPKIYGIFEHDAWHSAAAAAQLYCLPFGTPARADTSTILAEGRQIEAELVGRARWGWGSAPDPLVEAVKRREAAGTLPAAIFPNFREADDVWSAAFVDVEFPEPPRSEWQKIHRARLGGFEISAAAPASAIKVKGLAEAALAVRDRSQMVDPIIFGVLKEHESKVVVLGYYNTSEEDAMALVALIDVLEEMNLE